MFDLIRAFILKKGPHYSWKKVVAVIVLSSFAVTGVAALGLVIFSSIKRERAWEADEGGLVQDIVQMGSPQVEVPTAYFAEVLGLSADRQVSWGQFNLAAAQQK